MDIADALGNEDMIDLLKQHGGTMGPQHEVCFENALYFNDLVLSNNCMYIKPRAVVQKETIHYYLFSTRFDINK
jgi:hypothetical protein